MSRRAVKIKIEFLDILAMITFAVSQSEKPFFYNRVFPVPKGKGKTEMLLVIRKTSQTVFASAIGTGARMVVRKVVPGSTKFAVILSHSSPLPLAEIRPPFFPWDIFFS